MTDVYEVLIDDEKVDTLIVTNKDLSCIDIVDVLKGVVKVKNYVYFKDEYDNDFYRINGKAIVSFSKIDNGYSTVVMDIAKYTKEQKEALEELANALDKVADLAKGDSKFYKEIVSAKLEKVWTVSLYKMISDIDSVVKNTEVE